MAGIRIEPRTCPLESLHSPVPGLKRLKLQKLDVEDAVRQEAAQQKQNAQPVDDAVHKACLGCLREIFRWDGNFLNSEPKVTGLDQDLLVEDKFVGVQPERDLFENPAAIRAVAGVIFGQLQSESPIFKGSQEFVSQELPPRHALLHRAP